MTKNPFLNALSALLYIAFVAFIMFYGLKLSGQAGQKDTIFAPIAIISLFTLSAAVMGYVFLSQPLQLYFDGDKKGAVNLFLRTVEVFAVITFFILLALFFRGLF